MAVGCCGRSDDSVGRPWHDAAAFSRTWQLWGLLIDVGRQRLESRPDPAPLPRQSAYALRQWRLGSCSPSCAGRHTYTFVTHKIRWPTWRSSQPVTSSTHRSSSIVPFNLTREIRPHFFNVARFQHACIDVTGARQSKQILSVPIGVAFQLGESYIDRILGKQS